MADLEKGNTGEKPFQRENSFDAAPTDASNTPVEGIAPQALYGQQSILVDWDGPDDPDYPQNFPLAKKWRITMCMVRIGPPVMPLQVLISTTGNTNPLRYLRFLDFQRRITTDGRTIQRIPRAHGTGDLSLHPWFRNWPNDMGSPI